MKSGTHTERVQQALALIAGGMTAYRAAKEAGASLRHLYRVLKAMRKEAA